MRIFFRRFSMLFLAFTFVAVPWSAMASSETVGTDYQVAAAAMTGDAVLVRPLGVVSLALGFGIFVVSSPFSALGGNFGDAWGTLVTTPAKFTFARPLGKFESLPESP